MGGRYRGMDPVESGMNPTDPGASAFRRKMFLKFLAIIGALFAATGVLLLF